MRRLHFPLRLLVRCEARKIYLVPAGGETWWIFVEEVVWRHRLGVERVELSVGELQLCGQWWHSVWLAGKLVWNVPMWRIIYHANVTFELGRFGFFWTVILLWYSCCFFFSCMWCVHFADPWHLFSDGHAQSDHRLKFDYLILGSWQSIDQLCNSLTLLVVAVVVFKGWLLIFFFGVFGGRGITWMEKVHGAWKVYWYLAGTNFSLRPVLSGKPLILNRNGSIAGFASADIVWP